MRITDKIISIPPYISTSWDKVASVYMKEQELVISLKDNTQIVIPNLSSEVIEEIFNAHAAYLDTQIVKRPKEEAATTQTSENVLGLPFRLFFGTLESINQALQHNPSYSDLPPLPPEIVSKIELLAKAVPVEEISNLLTPQPGCNCVYCQMSRILKKATNAPHDVPEVTSHESTEEEVKEEELRFEQWEVRQIGDKMYQVTNKLDPKEHYSVYLGNPIGCTCGKPNCEHIVAVLRH